MQKQIQCCNCGMLRWTEAVQNETEKPEKQEVMMSNFPTDF